MASSNGLAQDEYELHPTKMKGYCGRYNGKTVRGLAEGLGSACSPGDRIERVGGYWLGYPKEYPT